MVKRLVIAVVLLTLVCGGLVGFNLFRQQAIETYFATMERPAVTVSATEVEATTWTPGIEAFGTVSAVRGVNIATETVGVVREILFAANDRIEAGQLLVQIEDSVEQADLLAARAAVDRDQQALQRARTLSDRGVSSTANFETAESALATSQSQLQRLEAVLDQKALEAPFDGIIGIPRIEVGEYVAAGTTVATLQDLDQMRADFTVREQDIDRLSIGQPIRAGIVAGEFPFQGTITGIDPRIDPASRLVSVRAALDNTNGSLRPGQFVRLEVIMPEEDNILTLPQTAIVTSLYGDYVYVVSEEPREAAAPAEGAAEGDEDAGPRLVARQVFVETGRRAGGIVEIRDGIEAGQRIVTAGQNKLSSGASVNIDNTLDPAQLVRR